MANPVWPASLQQRLEQQGYTERPPDNLQRTPMAKGPQKTRQNTTANERPVTGIIYCTGAQLDTLDAFFVTTLASGSLLFDSNLIRGGALVTARMVDIQYGAVSGDTHTVTLSLGIQP